MPPCAGHESMSPGQALGRNVWVGAIGAGYIGDGYIPGIVDEHAIVTGSQYGVEPVQFVIMPVPLVDDLHELVKAS